MEAAITSSLLQILASKFMSLTLKHGAYRRKGLLPEPPLDISKQPRRFRYHELVEATNNFDDDYKLGQGGFGPVYQGYLTDQDIHVAIKVLLSKQSSRQGQKEFEAEVATLTQVRHKNIVRLLGWCNSRHNGLMLVYELMAEGSLDKHLYNPDKFLTWEQRYKIILGLGYALRYLHNDCEKCIVHGDIKPANIMLDASHNAKLGDFGLARLLGHGVQPRTTQAIAGTLGYMDPKFFYNGRRCPELDVYSFGVVLLEIACGQRPNGRLPDDAPSLLAWVLDQSRILDAVDTRLNGLFNQRQMERVLHTALWCAHPDPKQRPSIAEAMDFLRSADAKVPVIPARHDAEHIRSLEALAFGDISDDYSSAPEAAGSPPSTYYTSNDLAYPRAEE